MDDGLGEFEIQVHRINGADESFEASDLDDAVALAREEIADADTRLVVVIETATGRVMGEWSQ